MSMEEAQIEAHWAWASGGSSQSSFPEGTNNWKISSGKTANMWESLKARAGKSDDKLESWLCLPLSRQIFWVSFGSSFSWTMGFPWGWEVELLNNILWT